MRFLVIAILFSFTCHGQTPMMWLTKKASSCSYLLDCYPTAAGAYSLRKLKASYSGYCIRVTRASDNTEQSIGFSGDELDTASLKSFLGGSDGRINTWYDQSGNSYDATQSTISNQPYIVSSGVIYRDNNGKPTLLFFPDNILDISIASTTITNQSIFCVFEPFSSGSDAEARVVSFRKSSASHDYDDYVPIIQNFTTTTSFGAYIGGNVANVTVSNSALNLYNAISDGSTIYNSVNNGTAVTYSYSLNQAVVDYTIGGSDFSPAVTSDGNLKGYVSEVIIYHSDKTSSRSGINGNINTFYSIY